MQLRKLVALAVVVSLMPVGSAAAAPEDDGLGDVDGSVDGSAEPAAEGPAEAPAAPLSTAPAPPTAVEPEYKGTGLIFAAVGLTGFSLISRFTSLGLTASFRNCTDLDCNGRFAATAAFLYMAPISQFIATGLVIPGGIIKGRHDGWRSVTTGLPQRNAKSFIVAGGVLFGVFTAISIALRPAYIFSLSNCVGDNIEGSSSTCGGLGGLVGYHVGVGLSDLTTTAGAGLMSYGIGYKGYTRRYGPKVSVAPLGSNGVYGLSVGGRF